ncbi:MAG: type III-B CRISPR module-associated Cmr3 family protein [Limisphaerales bacterium]
MNTILIEPTDLLFFRDAVPMAAGQGKGAGCRLPFPSTVHEAFRASLLRANGGMARGKREEGRPTGATRKGNWHSDGHDGKTFVASRAFRSLRTIGPLPWSIKQGLLVPVPMDTALAKPEKLNRLQLWRDDCTPWGQDLKHPSDYRPPCWPGATTPPHKDGQLHGWWTVGQMRRYLHGDTENSNESFRPLPSSALWEAEHHIGVEIEPESSAAKHGQLYAGSYLRPKSETRFAVQLHVGDPGAEANGEGREIAELDWLLLGGDFRLARLWHTTGANQPIPDCFADLKQTPRVPPGSGARLLKWVLATPAIFAHGSLPGWCVDTLQNRPGGPLPVGRVCLDLPGRAQLLSWCLGKPRTVSGWDVVDGCAKPTLLAVPEGGVYYFLCEDRPTAQALAEKLHWQPRSDFYGEKGCGYGLVSSDVQIHPTSPDIPALAKELFNR